MKKIIHALPITLQALGKQKIKLANYRPFLYSVAYEKNEGLLIYNLMTGAMLYLDESEKAYYAKNPAMDNELINTLIEEWFLVPEGSDDAKLFDQFYSLLNLVADSHIAPLNDFVIYPTTDCNARCFYCFERNNKHIHMSDKVARDTVDFIIKKGDKNGIGIHWFGGEPLYNMNAIDIITTGLRKNGIKFVTSMVTNGYLFDAENIKRAKTLWNLTRVQITLDGTENVYNRCKNYIYNDGSAFVRVMNNIQMLIENEIYVNIRLNVDEHNIDDLYVLVDQIYDRFGKHKYLGIYSSLLFESSTKRTRERSEDDRHILINKYLKFEEYFKTKFHSQYQKIGQTIRFKRCIADSNTSTLILPDGHLGKCEHYIDSHFYGSIYSDEIDQKMIDMFKKTITYLPKCNSCEFRPMCIGLAACKESRKTHCDDFDKMIIDKYLRDKMFFAYDKFLEGKK